ncbi:glycoside hydrolase family 5 protein [Halioglobus maricola]|uniref:Glycoside hydrolase family 5 protein n=1 Tax=Halioglobus maricola TaxID=2601894 RepID=A0A5P9NPC0_9GAMM|nr:cellulase family glycosylhydrolase [Halioglobus maricola]QFU77336.1 glycoside hydrolase family 5 protein [Halioglobus maricola]
MNTSSPTNLLFAAVRAASKHLLLVFLCWLPLAALAVEQNHGFTESQMQQGEWWNIPYPQPFDSQKLSEPQPWLQVQGNKLVDERGEVVQLRGVNIADPDKLYTEGQWRESLFAELADWGVTGVRIPIHPLAWRKRGGDWYLERLDEAVVWANAHGMYLIVDWHSIGNLLTEQYQHPMYRTSMVETVRFWRSVALRYAQTPTVAVYELFNEPTDDYIGTGSGSLGRASWQQWREAMESLIDVVRLYNPRAIPLVAGFNWAYDLTPVADAPIRREGIAYAVHPYPQKAKPKVKSREQFNALWQQQWGFAAEKYPLIATEMGWVREDGYGAHVPVIHNEGTYGPDILAFLDARDISWSAWVFDPDWSPTMIEGWSFKPTEQGAFFKKAMLRARAGD